MRFLDDVGAEAVADCYRALADAVDAGVYQLDADGRFVAVDDTMVEITGYAREDLLDEHVSLVVDDADVGRIEREIRGPPEAATPLAFTLETAAGERSPCEVRIVPLPDDGDYRGSVGIVRRAADQEECDRELERYRAIVETVDDGVYVVDPDGRFTMVNEAYVELTGYSRDELLGSHVSLVVDDDVAETAEDRERELIAGDRDTVVIEADIRTADGGTVPAEATFALLPGSDGTEYERVGVVREVTERRRARKELRESEARFRRMMEESPFSIQLFDADGRTIAANPAWERLWDASRDELGDYNILADEQLEAAGVMPYIRDAFAGEVVTLPVTHYDPSEIGKPGRNRWIEGYVYPLSPGGGEPSEVALVHYDVTELKEREQELERYEMAVETVWDGITILDSDDRFVLVNDAFCEITGYDREEVVGEHATIVLDESSYERAGKLYDEVVDGGSDTATLEYDLLTAADATVPVEARFGPVEYADGTVGGAGVVRDITERKRREWRLEELIDRLEESNRRLERFAYAASHDLQEPLRMVTSYLQLVEQRYRDVLDESGTEFLEFAIDGADRMREMIQGLLRYSRVDTRGGPLEPVEMDDVIADVRDDLRTEIAESSAEITVGDLPRVHGDREQLRQVFRELLDNAIEYGGDAPHVEIEAERRDEECEFRVVDDGIGMDPAHTDDVFEVFRRLHTIEEYSGTGIGLALCQRIVERHGGDIRVESEPGDGSTFYVTFPRRPAE